MLVHQNELYEKQIEDGIKAALDKIDMKQLAEHAFEANFKRALTTAFDSWEFKQKLGNKVEKFIWDMMNEMMDKKGDAVKEAINNILKA